MRHTGFVYNRENGLCQLKIPVGTSNLTLFPAETAAFGKHTHTHTHTHTHPQTHIMVHLCVISPRHSHGNSTHTHLLCPHTPTYYTHMEKHISGTVSLTSRNPIPHHSSSICHSLQSNAGYLGHLQL